MGSALGMPTPREITMCQCSFGIWEHAQAHEAAVSVATHALSSCPASVASCVRCVGLASFLNGMVSSWVQAGAFRPTNRVALRRRWLIGDHRHDAWRGFGRAPQLEAQQCPSRGGLRCVGVCCASVGRVACFSGLPATTAQARHSPEQCRPLLCSILTARCGQHCLVLWGWGTVLDTSALGCAYRASLGLVG